MSFWHVGAMHLMSSFCTTRPRHGEVHDLPEARRRAGGSAGRKSRVLTTGALRSCCEGWNDGGTLVILHFRVSLERQSSD